MTYESETTLQILQNIERTLKANANFDAAVKLFKLNLISLNEFLECVKRYTPDISVDEGKIRNEEIERIKQNIAYFKSQEQINNASMAGYHFHKGEK